MSSTALHIVSNLEQILLAVLLIGAVMHWHGLLTTKYKLKWKSFLTQNFCIFALSNNIYSYAYIKTGLEKIEEW